MGQEATHSNMWVGWVISKGLGLGVVGLAVRGNCMEGLVGIGLPITTRA